MNLKNLLILAVCAVSISSCKNGLFNKNKKEKSDVTGWNYNDKNMGGYQVSKEKEQRTGPGLVFVQGGTFTMGAVEEDVMGDWNNIPTRKTVNSFYIDQSEVANIHYREYLYWINNVFDGDEFKAVREGALPDTLVWRSELAYNEPMVEYYFRHPSYNYYPRRNIIVMVHHRTRLWPCPAMPIAKEISVKPKVRKAVIPAAGIGTRLLPVTKTIPKELLLVVDRPAIQYVVEEAVAAGIEEIIFVISRNKESIGDYFTPNRDLDKWLVAQDKGSLVAPLNQLLARIRTTCVYQDQPRGLGHAVLCAQEAVGEEPCLVILPDDLGEADPPLAVQMMRVYEQTGIGRCRPRAHSPGRDSPLRGYRRA